MSTFSTLAACLAEWQGRAGNLFPQTLESNVHYGFFSLRDVVCSEGTVMIMWLLIKSTDLEYEGTVFGFNSFILFF
jgi:hypothetical protein